MSVKEVYPIFSFPKETGDGTPQVLPSKPKEVDL